MMKHVGNPLLLTQQQNQSVGGPASAGALRGALGIDGLLSALEIGDSFRSSLLLVSKVELRSDQAEFSL